MTLVQFLYERLEHSPHRLAVSLHAGTHLCVGAVEDGENDLVEWETCPTLRLLALPFADHPDYEQDWKP